MNRPLISVLMVAYNSSKFIREAIESVLRQTYSNFELVIVDDHSSDNTWEIITSYNDARIRKYRNDSNLGEYPNRYKAISLAVGEYLIFIDGDDVVYPHGLQFMMHYAQEFQDCAMIISRPWDERIVFPLRVSPHQLYCFEYLDRGAIGINFTKVLFKTDVIKGLPVFPNGIRLGDEYIQYAIGMNHPSVLIPDASTWWRRTSGQASEKLVKDHVEYLKHGFWIKLEMLSHAGCPLNESERKTAFVNLYGGYLRFLLKQLFKLRLSDLFGLLSQYPVPARYLKALFIKQRRTYFSQYSGNRPLRYQNGFENN